MTRSSSQRTSTLVVLAFFLLIGTLEATSLYMGRLRTGAPVSLLLVLRNTVPSWSIQIVLVWPVLWLARKVRVGPGTWLRAVPIHLLGAFVFTVLTLLGTALILRAFGDLGNARIGTVVFNSFFAFAANQFAIYAVLVGVFHAIDYLQESEQRERERVRLAASLSEARLHALRSQLSPHFFFNTLNAISTFALQERPERVGDMVGALGDLLRASLDERLPHQVPLARELELLDLYLEIQRARFADWLRIEQEVGPETNDVLVPSLMLQPLVENAIEHGANGVDGANLVRIRCRIEAQRLRIDVENRRPAVAEVGDGLRLGLGLRNTRDRLEQLFPGEHELRLGPTENGGFVTTVWLPARRAVVESNGERA